MTDRAADLSEYHEHRLHAGLRQLMEVGASVLEVARAGLWLYGPDRDRMHRAHLFHRSSGEHASGGELRRDHFPEYFEALDRDPLIAAADVHSDSRTRGLINSYARPLGINAWIDAPVPGPDADDPPWGIVRFEQLGPRREWGESERSFARQLGSLLGALLAYFDGRRGPEAGHARDEEAREPAGGDDGGEEAGSGEEASGSGEEEPEEGPPPEEDAGESGPRPGIASRLAHLSPMGLALADAGGEVLTANPAMSRLLGWSAPGDLEGTSLRERCVRPSEWDDLADKLLESGRIDGWELQLRRADGNPVWLLLSAVRAEEAMSREATEATEAMVMAAVDISERKAVHARLQRQANRDPLTGAANRRLLQEAAEGTLALAQRHGRQAALLYVDLRRFKKINDVYGHEVGDRVLTHVADRLRARGRESDLTARIGGDEFAVLLAEVEGGLVGGRKAAERMMDALRPPIKVDDLEIDVDVTIGVALYPDHGRDVQTLLRRADEAMYRGKTSESGTIVVCDSGHAPPDPEEEGGGPDASVRNGGHASPPPDGEPDPPAMSSAPELAAVPEEDRLELHWQPIFRGADGARVGAEALLRWNHPTRGRLPAASFIRRAEEEADRIQTLDLWTLEQAVQHLPTLLEREGLKWIALNVSPLSLLSSDYGGALEEMASSGEIAPRNVLVQTGLELGRHPVAAVGGALASLRERGFGTALDLSDGFGRLVDVAVDVMEIDAVEVTPQLLRSLGNGDPGGPLEAARRERGLKLFAKKVEAEDEYRSVREAGCEMIQGYYLGRPVPLAELGAGNT